MRTMHGFCGLAFDVLGVPESRAIGRGILARACARSLCHRRVAPPSAPLRRSDDNASVKPKMLYASSKDALKKGLTGINEEYQATERGDLDLAEIKKKAGSV